MCGICGIVNAKREREDDLSIKGMTALLTHRGPDGEGYYDSGDALPSVHMGHRRLSIIDLAGGGQPMSNEDGTVWIVFNGEIYNFADLRADLEKRGHRFKSKTDTETIVHLYEEYGTDALKYLRGMFAFAIYDTKKRLLFAARDHVGVKPFYYSLNDGVFLFASEIKSILAYPRVPRELDKTAVLDYLSYLYIPAPKTMYRVIRKLPPAHYLLLEDGKLTVRRYWSLDFRNAETHSEEEYAEGLKAQLAESVKNMLVSDVPLGAFLSGGIDSSIIVSLMSKAADKPVKTFSIGFEESEFNELKYSRTIAELFRTDHREILLKPDVMEIFPAIVKGYDEPFGDSSAIPTYYISKAAREHVTVCLSGDGGDESYLGYNRYPWIKEHGDLPWVDWMPYPIRRALFGTMATMVPSGWKGKGRLKMMAQMAADRCRDYAGAMTPQTLFALLSPAFAEEMREYDSYALYRDRFRSSGVGSALTAFQYVDFNTYLPDDILTKVDIASMMNSLEVRVPFLDHKVLEYAAKIPTALKLKGATRKYILRKAFERDMPPGFFDRGKMGFSIPVRHWLKRGMMEYARDLLLGRESLFFRREAVQSLLEEHLTGARDHGDRIWSLLFLEEWLRTHRTTG